MGKYRLLGEYLTQQKGASCTLTFGGIERIIGDSLPPSARNPRNCAAWWSNDGTHPQARSWMQAGWHSAGRPDVDAGQVRFVRATRQNRPPPMRTAGGPRAQVTVRNLDAAVVTGLKQRAKRNGVSLEQELRTLLTRASRPGRAALLAEADRIRSMAAGPLTDSVSLLRADRDSR